MGRLARDLTNKLIHAPTAGLRQLAKEGGKRDVSRMAAMLGLTDLDEERDEVRPSSKRSSERSPRNPYLERLPYYQARGTG